MAGITLKTVARAAGVSVTTVSNAYNRPNQLSPSVRDKVLETARALGYAGPNAMARSLRQGKAGAIGVMFHDTLSYALTDPYAVEFMRGIAGVAEAHDTALLLLPVGGLDTEVACSATRNAMVDGFCLECIQDSSPIIDVIRERDLPVVSTMRSQTASLPFVGIDERAAARQAGEHLRKLGHRSIGVITPGLGATQGGLVDGIPDVAGGLIDMDEHLRIEGLREGTGQESSIEVVIASRNDRVHGERAAEALLDRQDRPTAVFTMSDVMALGVLDAMNRRGLTPGRDVSVIGFDDVAAAEDAHLTTIRQPVYEKGRLAAAFLLEPDTSPAHTTLPTELVVRASTGPVPH